MRTKTELSEQPDFADIGQCDREPTLPVSIGLTISITSMKTKDNTAPMW